jgi:hypothetical protein
MTGADLWSTGAVGVCAVVGYGSVPEWCTEGRWGASLSCFHDDGRAVSYC